MNFKRTGIVFAGVLLATSSTFVFTSKPGISANPSPNVSHKSIEPSQKGTLLAQSFPLRGKRFDELGDHRRMETSITISNNGRIDGVTRTWTAHKHKGFTGGVAVVLMDSAGNILHVTQEERYGVNCRRCPGPSDRTVQWAQTVPANLISQVRGYAIFHAHSPKGDVGYWTRTAKSIYQVFK